MEFDVARPFLFDGINHKFIFIFFARFSHGCVFI